MDRTILTLEEIKALIPAMPDRFGFGDSIYLCKSGPLAGQFAIDTPSEPAIDEAAMTVRMRISTSQLDRVNHVVKQSGILLDMYRDNPVVLFGHGMDGITLPVAQSEDPDGNLTVTTEQDGTYAKAHHNKANKLSSQFFDLVVQKYLRASSIGITPTVMSKGYDTQGDEVLFIEEGYLNEWSYCTIGINPGCRVINKSLEMLRGFHDLQCEAANRILLSNTLDGTSIHPVIKKSLQASLVVPVSSPGIKFEEKPIMKKLTVEQVKQMKPKQLAKAMMELKEFDEETQGMVKAAVEMMPDEIKKDDMTPAPGPAPEEMTETPEVEVAEEPSDETPLGARVLRSIYESINGLIDTSMKALGPVEATDVKEAATEVLNQFRDLNTSLEGVFSSKYADEPALVPATEEPTDDVVKSFLAMTNRGRDQLQGLSARVDMVSKSVVKAGGKISASHLKLLSQTASDLARLNTQAKSFKPVKPADPVEPSEDYKAVVAEFQEFKKQFKSLVDTLSVTPAPLPKS